MKTLLKFIFLLVITNTTFNITAQENIKIGIEMDSSQAMLLGTSTDSLGSKLFWYPNKSILLVGTGFAFGEPNTWNLDNIGEFSTSFGVANAPLGPVSMMWGITNVIDENSVLCTAFGRNNFIEDNLENVTVWGVGNVIRGNNGTAWGNSNSIQADNGTVFGKFNTIFGDVSTVWGELNQALNSHTTVGGYGNVAKGKYSTALGLGLLTNGAASTVLGAYNDTTLLVVGSNDVVTPNTPLVVVGNGEDFGNRSNAFSVFASGFVKIGNGPALADLHIKQSADDDDVTSAGIRLENKGDDEYWQIYSSGTKLSFGRFGNQVAYIDEDGSFVDNTMLFQDEDDNIPLMKSKQLPSLNRMQFKNKSGKNYDKKIKLDAKSLKNHFSQLLRYDEENAPVAIDKDQLLLLALAKIKQHESILHHQSELILAQGKLIKKLELKIR